MTIQTHEEIAREARIAYFRQNPAMIEEKSCAQARADRSDPFTYDRIRTHFHNGVVVEPSDYSVTWKKERREGFFDGRKVEFVVAVPRDIKRV